MKLTVDEWDIGHLQTHLQAAAELEAWTIPYYLSAMFSVVDDTSDAAGLIRSVANQEMLHLQLVGNIANAYGYSPAINKSGIFAYQGTTVPHLDFSLDPDSPTEQFSPYSAEIGPLDESRINAMCLIEYPEWDTGGHPDYHDDVSEYGSIGEFYDALEDGALQLATHIRGDVNQNNIFTDFYPKLPMTVTSSGVAGFAEVALLMSVIRDQGEAAKAKDEIAVPFRNTLDDPDPSASHFQKFIAIRDAELPATYPVRDPGTYTPDDLEVRQTLLDDFARFTDVVTDLLAGRNPAGFDDLMGKIGSDIQACWKNGVTPEFS